MPIPHQQCHLLLGLLLQFKVSKNHKSLIMRCFWMSCRPKDLQDWWL